MRGALVAIVLAGCSFGPSATQIDAGSAADAAGDGPMACLATGAWEVCVPTPNTAAMPGSSINTSPGTSDCTTVHWGSEQQPEACAVIGTTVTIGAATLVFGSRPLVIVATDTITVSALLDASSHDQPARSIAPGANAGCVAAAMAPTNNQATGGGGAGGTLVTKGGDGGSGASGSSAGGVAAPNATAPATLHGGCAGQNGGDGNTTSGLAHGGVGGNGGGAVYLVAGNTIAFTDGGAIAVSGAGGTGGGLESGGGGGGSGGMIVMIAQKVTAMGTVRLVANGGAGSSGGDFDTDGTNAPDPDPTMTTTQQGAVNGAGGAGEPGFAGATLATTGNASNSGGGGGGGGGGYIQANEAFSTPPIASPMVVLQ